MVKEIGIRAEILSWLKRHDKTRGWLATQVKDDMCASMVFGWLAGRSGMTLDKQAKIAAACGMKLVVKTEEI